MNPIGATELARLRRAQESFFPDACVFVTITTTYDEWGDKVEVETVSAAKRCRFVPQASFSTRQLEYADTFGTVQRMSAILRLSVDEYANISTTSRVKIVERNNEALTVPMTFDVMGDPQLVSTSVHVNLQDVSR